MRFQNNLGIHLSAVLNSCRKVIHACLELSIIVKSSTFIHKITERIKYIYLEEMQSLLFKKKRTDIARDCFVKIYFTDSNVIVGLILMFCLTSSFHWLLC